MNWLRSWIFWDCHLLVPIARVSRAEKPVAGNGGRQIELVPRDNQGGVDKIWLVDSSFSERWWITLRLPLIGGSAT
jgi:hypothetical protein